MKRYVVLWLVLSYVSAGTHVFGEEEAKQYSDFTSFRGIEWGQHISAIPGEVFELQLEDGTVKYYTRQSDKLTIGSVSVEKIHYGFWRDQFLEAKISVLDSTEAMLKELEAVLGDYDHAETNDTKWFYGEESYRWEKPRTRVTLVSPATRWDKEATTCTVTITSKKVLGERAVYEAFGHVIHESKEKFSQRMNMGTTFNILTVSIRDESVFCRVHQ
jgi:hypothetical protein